MYIYRIYIYIHTYIYVIYIYIHICMNIYIYPVYIHICMYAYAHAQGQKGARRVLYKVAVAT